MHVHTTFSPDGISTMEECCESALKKRLAKICFTDHVDWNSAEKNLNKVYDNRKNNFNIKAYFNKIAECRVAYPSLEILTGIEFSEPSLFPEEFLSYSKLPFDYILGSVHHCYNGIFPGAANIDEKRAIQEYYEIMMRSIENYEIQAMAHFDFPRIFFDKWKLDDKVLNNILKLMINKNVVLEINTSTVFEKNLEPMPGFSIIKRYVELGGSKVVLGSDAHRCFNIANKFQYLKSILSSELVIGFIKNREFIPI